MKKGLLLAVLITVLSVATYSQGIIYGGGLALGTEVGINDDISEGMALGLNVHGGYGFTEKIAVLGNFNYFFPSGTDTYDLMIWQAAADVHYKFLGSDNLGIYALGGLNLSYEKRMPTTNATYQSTIIAMGFEIGAGVDFSIFFAELKYDTGFDQVQLSGGVRF